MSPRRNIRLFIVMLYSERQVFTYPTEKLLSAMKIILIVYFLASYLQVDHLFYIKLHQPRDVDMSDRLSVSYCTAGVQDFQINALPHGTNLSFVCV